MEFARALNETHARAIHDALPRHTIAPIEGRLLTHFGGFLATESRYTTEREGVWTLKS
jgi:hypothetical protein